MSTRENFNLTTFFYIVAPGLEEMALDELKQTWQYFSEEPLCCRVIKGGIEFDVPMNIGPVFNSYLKLGVRALMRITSFKARDFPQIFNRLKKIPWEKYIKGHKFRIKASSKKSRLIHSQKLEQTAISAIEKYMRSYPPSKKERNQQSKIGPTDIYLRLENDIATLSIDTTGDPLFKRGDKAHSIAAPIRESKAHALLQLMANNGPSSSQEIHLIDPMCGSGTFLLEADNWYRPNDKRPFQFQTFPIFTDSKPEHHPKKARLNCLGPNFTHFTGIDLNLAHFSASKENLKNITNLDLYHDDFRNISLKKFSSARWAVVNPPYQKRIKSKDNFGRLIKDLLTWSKENQIEKLGLVIPTEKLGQFKFLNTILKDAEKILAKNGGIPVYFTVIDPSSVPKM